MTEEEKRDVEIYLTERKNLPPGIGMQTINECTDIALSLENGRRIYLKNQGKSPFLRSGIETLNNMPIPAKLINLQNRKYWNRATSLYQSTRKEICVNLCKRFRQPITIIPPKYPLRYDFPIQKTLDTFMQIATTKYAGPRDFVDDDLAALYSLIPEDYRSYFNKVYGLVKNSFREMRIFLARLEKIKILKNYVDGHGKLYHADSALSTYIALEHGRFQAASTTLLERGINQVIPNVILMAYYCDNLNTNINTIGRRLARVFAYCDYIVNDFRSDLIFWKVMLTNDHLLKSIKIEDVEKIKNSKKLQEAVKRPKGVIPKVTEARIIIEKEDSYLPQFGYSRLKGIIGKEECEKVFCENNVEVDSYE